MLILEGCVLEEIFPFFLRLQFFFRIEIFHNGWPQIPSVSVFVIGDVTLCGVVDSYNSSLLLEFLRSHLYFSVTLERYLRSH